MIYEQHIKIYKKCDLLTEELTSLERLSDGHIDHPKNFSKDQADAVCGATYLASEFADEYSYSYGENLTTSLDVNLGPSSDEFNKRQMIADFEAELRAIYTEEEAFIDLERQKQKEIYQRYQDISDGIIIF
jgi:hypothetical protein